MPQITFKTMQQLYNHVHSADVALHGPDSSARSDVTLGSAVTSDQILLIDFPQMNKKIKNKR